MKTIKCESCSNEISPEAVTCPKCGYPDKKAAHSSEPQETNQDEDLRAALLEGLRDDGYRD